MSALQKIKHDVTSDEFYEEFKTELFEVTKDDPNLDSFVEKEFGINAMELDFPDIEDKNEENFVFDKVRGNTRLIDGAIMTHKEANDLIDEVLDIEP